MVWHKHISASEHDSKMRRCLMIRHFRMKKKYTQKSLAKELGVSQVMMSQYESGACKMSDELFERCEFILGFNYEDGLKAINCL